MLCIERSFKITRLVMQRAKINQRERERKNDNTINERTLIYVAKIFYVQYVINIVYLSLLRLILFSIILLLLLLIILILLLHHY